MFKTSEWRATRVLSGCRPRVGETGATTPVAVETGPDGLVLRASCPGGRYRVEIVIPGVGGLPPVAIPHEIIAATSGVADVRLHVDRAVEIRCGDAVYTAPIASGGVPRVGEPPTWVRGPGSDLAAVLDLAAAGDGDRDQTPFRTVVVGGAHAVAGQSGGRIAVLGPTVPWLFDAFGTVRLPLDRVAWLRGVLSAAERFAVDGGALFVAAPGMRARIPLWTEATPLDAFATSGLGTILQRLPAAAEVATPALTRAIGSETTVRITSGDGVLIASETVTDEIDAVGCAGFSALVSADRLRVAVGMMPGEMTTIRGTAAAVVLQSGERTAFLLAQRA